MASGIPTAQNLLAAQLGVCLGCRVDANSSAYNLGQYVEISGRMRPELLERALRQVIHEADTLRVSVLEVNGGPQ
jgi:Condensation domain